MPLRCKGFSSNFTHGSESRTEFFGCRKYKSKADSGCGYFDWVDDKVAALNDKIALVNALND
ncbi:hypothetical protein LINPERHAP2_LOCUS25939, partial [Linum perenne]